MKNLLQSGQIQMVENVLNMSKILELPFNAHRKILSISVRFLVNPVGFLSEFLTREFCLQKLDIWGV